MEAPYESRPDDGTLVRYLLRLLPDEETERIEELSIADDEVAGRLLAVENDLVDAYVQGTLTGETLEHFKSVYLSSPQLRDKVRFAADFQIATAAAAARANRFVPRVTARWPLASAAMLCLAGVALVYQTTRPRHEQREARRERAADVARRPPAVEPASPRHAALVLVPQMRDAGPIPALTVPPGANRVSFELRLEPNDFSRYQVALKHVATNRTVWRSDMLAANTDRETPALDLSVSAGVFEAGYYAFEVTGRAGDGRGEIIGSYPFGVARS